MAQSLTTGAPSATSGLPRGAVAILAFAVGGVVANLFYAQPLEHSLAEALHSSTRSMGFAVTAVQVGYAVGLATLVPLGDLVERRRLIVPMLGFAVLGLLAMAAVPSFALFVAAATLVGLTSVAVQVMVPFAADLAPAESRGRVVSTVMSGLLIGVLVSRTVSGLIAGLAGWRAVFVFGAALTALFAALLWWRLPRVAPKVRMSYPALLRSVLDIVRDEPALRLRMLYGGLCFASFSAFWTSAGFMLAAEPYRWNTATIGAFALVGAAGAFAARFAGRLADRGLVHAATGAFLAVTAGSYLLIELGHASLSLLIIGTALMDLGCQGVHISNQSVIYALRPDARSRINTAYMTSYFVAGAIGSALSAAVYSSFGWSGVSAIGFVLPAAGVLVWAFVALRARRPQPVEG